MFAGKCSGSSRARNCATRPVTSSSCCSMAFFLIGKLSRSCFLTKRKTKLKERNALCKSHPVFYPSLSTDLGLQPDCSPSDLLPLPSLLTLILELWEKLDCWQNGWKIKCLMFCLNILWFLLKFFVWNKGCSLFFFGGLFFFFLFGKICSVIVDCWSFYRNGISSPHLIFLFFFFFKYLKQGRTVRKDEKKIVWFDN